MEALSAAGTDLGPSGLEVGAVEFMPVGPSPGESQRARALRLWVGKGVLRPQPIQDPALPGEPSLPACAWPPTVLCLLQQLPARGGAHAGARPRRGGLLPAVRVQVRGAEHHHHQGARPAPPTARPRPPRGPAHQQSPCPSTAVPRPPSFSLPSGSSPRFGAALPSDTIVVAGGTRERGWRPLPLLFPFPLPSCHLFSGQFQGSGCALGTMRHIGRGGICPPEPPAWLTFQSNTKAAGLAGRVPDAPFDAPEPSSRGSLGELSRAGGRLGEAWSLAPASAPGRLSPPSPPLPW